MSAKTIIFLPGFMCDERLFTSQIAACSKAGYNAVAADMTVSSSIAGIAENIIANAPDSFALAGLSMGGIVALEIMKQASSRVSHLALLNSTPHADKMQKQRKEQISRVADGELGLVMQEELKPRYLAPCNRNQERLNLLAQMGNRLGKFAFSSQSIALMMRQSYVETLSQIKCPTLVLTGYEDWICTPEIHIEMAAKIAPATLTILPDCGHLSTIEKPDDVNAALLNLLRQEGRHNQFDSNKRKGLRLVV